MRHDTWDTIQKWNGTSYHDTRGGRIQVRGTRKDLGFKANLTMKVYIAL